LTDSAPDTLAAALARHQVEVTEEQRDMLDRYCRLLWEWNEKLNLTRHTDYEKFVTRDLADSLHIAKLLVAGERILDVGTGGGVPGILIAILRRDVQVSLCDSVAKKTLAVHDMAEKLDLPIDTHNSRVEELLEDERYTSLVARAVGPLDKLLTWLKHHWPAVGRLLAIKGPKWVDERGQARHLGLLKPLELRVVDEYPMPGTESKSVILQIWPKGKKLPGEK